MSDMFNAGWPSLGDWVETPADSSLSGGNGHHPTLRYPSAIPPWWWSGTKVVALILFINSIALTWAVLLKAISAWALLLVGLNLLVAFLCVCYKYVEDRGR